MSYALNQGVKIYFDEVGQGSPLLLLHEFAGDYRSWQDTMRALARNHRCITMSARGYPPSDVPERDADYGQELANADAVAILDHLGIDKAHVAGHSMGAYTALQLSMFHGDRVLSAVPVAAGSGSLPSMVTQFRADAAKTSVVMEKAARIEAEKIAVNPTRIQLKIKDPIGWQIMVDHLASHPPAGQARVLRNVQGKRPSLYDLEAELRGVSAPVLLILGDEDEPCLDVNLFMKRTMRSARLAMLPGCGHGVPSEEPAAMALLIERFLASVDRGTWRPRHPSAIALVDGKYPSTVGGKD